MSAALDYSRRVESDMAEINAMRERLRAEIRERVLPAVMLAVGDCTRRLWASAYYEAYAASVATEFARDVLDAWENAESQFDAAERRAGDR